MDGGLSKNSKDTRLNLSKLAIQLLIEKLKPEDAFSLTIFNN
jgi:hypothetical protein